MVCCNFNVPHWHSIRQRAGTRKKKLPSLGSLSMICRFDAYNALYTEITLPNTSTSGTMMGCMASFSG